MGDIWEVFLTNCKIFVDGLKPPISQSFASEKESATAVAGQH